MDYYNEIQYLEDELSKTKYNKKTQYHVGLVKAKIAKLKEKEITRGKGKGGEGYAVRKSGDATVILIGFPSSGKSTLLNELTGADSPVGAYEFTTLKVIPGMLNYKQSQIQILDVPGIIKGAALGKGRGKEVLAVMQNADLAIILVDVLRPQALYVLKKEVYDTHIRLNQRKPDVKIARTARGGIKIGKTLRLTWLTDEMIRGILQEFRLNNAEIVIREDITIDQLIDVIENNKHYIPGLVVLNKVDLLDERQLRELTIEMKTDICISADRKLNTDALKDMIFNRLQFMRIYCKEVSAKADMDVPLILRRGATLKSMCERLHREFVDKFKYARIWSKSSKIPGQRMVNINYALHDEDIVELHT